MTNNNYLKHLSTLKTLILVLILVMMLTGCGENKNSYIFVVDLTQSVSGEAKNKAFEAIKKQAQKLKRGDSITVIPLNGDAVTETSGNVIRLQVSERREAFDADLKKFAAEVGQRLTEMQVNTSAKTYKQTDLFGALRVAHDEVAVTEKENRKFFLIVLSDLVQSTKEIRFEKDAIFQKTETAKKYAEKVSQGRETEWRGVQVYLGLLQSTDLQQMPGERREAVREFWQEFFRLSGTERYQFATDGIGQLPKFIDFSGKS